MDGSEGLDPLAKTALWTASMRAREHAREDRLFSDPLAGLLGGEEGQQIMRRFEGEVQRGVEDPALAVRTRFLDDHLRRLDEGGIRQFVFVAAGMDTRAFRLAWSRGTVLFELDRPALIKLKDDLVVQAGAKPVCERVTVGVDLLADWLTPLRSAGFDPDQPTVWLVEGLLYFLTSAERDLLLSQLFDVSAAGSFFLADYVGQSTLDSPAMAAWRARMAAQGHPWKSGSDHPEQLFDGFGWSAQVTAYGEPGADYARWTSAAVEPGVPGTRGRYLVVAERA